MTVFSFIVPDSSARLSYHLTLGIDKTIFDNKYQWILARIQSTTPFTFPGHIWLLRGFHLNALDSPKAKGGSESESSHGIQSPTAGIVDHIQKDLREWLTAESRKPVKICSRTSPVEMSSNLSPVHIVFGHIRKVAECQKNVLTTAKRHMEVFPSGCGHIELVDASHQRPQYPEPDFIAISAANAPATPAYTAAFMALMRSAQISDTSSDFMFERQMKASISELYGENVQFLPETDCTEIPHGPSKARHLLIAGGCTAFTLDVQQQMASYAQPILEDIIQTYEERSKQQGCEPQLPKFAFVYGIHWSKSRVRILVHYPTFNIRTQAYDFVQVVLAEHYHGWSLRDTDDDIDGGLHLDDMFLYRWRLTVAMFAVRAQVNELLRWLNGQNEHPSTRKVAEEAVDGARAATTSEGKGGQDLSLPAYLAAIRGVWRGQLYEIPEEWLTLPQANQAKIDPDVVQTPVDITFNITGELLLHYLRAIGSTSLRQLSTEELARYREPDTNSLCPDFLLHPNLPRRMRIKFPTEDLRILLMQRGNWGTTVHQARCLDLLSARVTVWDDFNLIIAGAFSGSSGYELRWRPADACDHPTVSSEIITDFILVHQDRLPSNEEQLQASIVGPHLAEPANRSNPAVLLGLRTTALYGDGHVLSNDEMVALHTLAEWYADILRQHLCLPVPDRSQGATRAFSAETCTTIFCTFLKSSHMHILAVSVNMAPSGDDEGLKIHHVDVIPLSMAASDADAYRQRLRLFVALSTLQRHVCRFAEQRAGAYGSPSLEGGEDDNEIGDGERTESDEEVNDFDEDVINSDEEAGHSNDEN